MEYNGGMDCHQCTSYRSGSGSKACLRCDKYTEILKKSIKRKTINYIVIPDEILSNIADDRQSYDMIAALRALSPRHAAAISLHYIAGLTQLQVASIMHLSRTQIRLDLEAATAHLKKILLI